MNNRMLCAALLGLIMTGGFGLANAWADSMMTDSPYFFIVEDVRMVSADQPKSQQDVVGYTNTVNPRPVYRWERQLQEDKAARELIQEQLTGRQPDENYNGFFENYYRTYN